MVSIGHSMKFGSIEDIIIERINFSMLCKSIISYDRIYKWIEKQDFEAFNDGTFKASRNWYDGMLKRNNLVPRAATQLVKKDDQYLIESVAKHILQVKSKLSIYSSDQIVFADETAIWMNLGIKRTLATTGTNQIPIFAGFSEKRNVTVMCAVRQNHEKIIPLIVHPTNSAPKFNTIEIQTNKILGYTKKGWVTQELLKKYMDYVFPFGNGLLVWDQASAHTGSEIESYFQMKNIEVIKVPAGTTGYCQLADVGLIKSFKAGIRKSILDFYDEQVDEFQANPNKPKVFQKPGIVKLRDWIVCEWAKVTPEIIEKTLKTCYLSENVEELHMAKVTGLGSFI
eukprot:NODE_672_length_4853_cov_0.171855.p1 type:complete len:340 gc:universal NODE_672_length_4853_cov_0.171855:3670-4689(+)